MPPNAAAARIFEHHALTADALAEQLAAAIAESLRRTIAARGHALLAVSGGRSAASLFDALCQSDLRWAAVTVVMVDERWVAASDAASNAGLVHRHLLQGPARAACLLALKTDAGLTLEVAVEHYETQLRALPLPLDVAIVGMGEDGHTASIFATADNLAALVCPQGQQLCHATRPAGLAQARMTLGLSTLAAAGQLILSFVGAEKWQVYRRALAAPQPALPVSLLLAAAAAPVAVWTTP